MSTPDIYTVLQIISHYFILIISSVSDAHKLLLYLDLLQPCVEAFQRDGVRGGVLNALLIFSQLGLQSPLTIVIPEDLIS